MATEQPLYVVQPQKRDPGKAAKPPHKPSHHAKSKPKQPAPVPEAAAPVSPSPNIAPSAPKEPTGAAARSYFAAEPTFSASKSAAEHASEPRFAPEQAAPPPPMTRSVTPTAPSSAPERSYFDGKLLQLIGWSLLGALITLVTLGICYPWAVCMIYSCEAKHTVINGKRLQFDGTALQLFGT